MIKKRIICITPIRNEAWTLPRFLKCAETWADEIIILDQKSTDGSREIASAHHKVRLLSYAEGEFQEAERRTLLVAEARRSGADIILGLDADECLTSNFLDSTEWDSLCKAEPGTIITIRWLNVLPGGYQVKDSDYDLPFGYVDDGCPFTGFPIHGPRAPTPSHAPTLNLVSIRLLHYNFFDPDRLESKRRWYMAVERRLFPRKSAIEIFDKYNYSGVHANRRVYDLKGEYIDGYERLGIDMKKLVQTRLPKSGLPVYWYDRELAAWLDADVGVTTLRDISIWSRQWMTIWSELAGGSSKIDPRPWWLVVVHRVMALGERHRFSWPVRVMFSVLRRSGF